ncbi:MAG TPA: hypothetical protein VKZ73_02550 [Microbacterium sp.]|nr:hypothetical protein [Microbacterium sp.]
MALDDVAETIELKMSPLRRLALTEALQAYLAEQESRVAESIELHDVPETLWYSERAEAAQALMDQLGIERGDPVNWRAKYRRP